MTKDEEEVSGLALTDRKDIDSQREGRRGIQFPWKLHELLEQTEKDGKADVISWLPGGKSFKVHKKEEFCRDIMPAYFNSSKYKTWQRSLNLWGFESVVRGPDKGACYHSAFVRGYPDLCKNMTRVKIKGTIPESSVPASVKATSTAAASYVPSANPQATGTKFPAMNSFSHAQKPAISEFLRSKVSGTMSDSMLEAALARRLSHSMVRSQALPGLSPAFMSSMPSLGGAACLSTPMLGGASAAGARHLIPPSSANRILSAISTAAAALDVLRQEEAEIYRRAQYET